MSLKTMPLSHEKIRMLWLGVDILKQLLGEIFRKSRNEMLKRYD